MNSYYLLAGLLAILLSVAHALWGERYLFNQPSVRNMDPETQVSLYVPWHQISYVLLASGIGLLLAANLTALAGVPYFILALIAGNFVVFVVVLPVKKQTSLFSKTLPQAVLFLVLIVLIVLGIASSG